MQRRAAVGVGQFELCPSLEELQQHVYVAILGGGLQGCPPAYFGAEVGIGTRVQQQIDERRPRREPRVVARACLVERFRVAAAHGQIDGGARLEQEPHSAEHHVRAETLGAAIVACEGEGRVAALVVERVEDAPPACAWRFARRCTRLSCFCLALTARQMFDEHAQHFEVQHRSLEHTRLKHCVALPLQNRFYEFGVARIDGGCQQ